MATTCTEIHGVRSVLASLVGQEPSLTATRERTEIWMPALPEDIDGQLLVPLPDGFEVTDEWWNELLGRNDLIRIELTRDRKLRCYMGSSEGSRISFWVGYFLAAWIEAGGGGDGFESASEFISSLGERKRPDGAWISDERLPDHSQPWRHSFRMAPDFMFEVRSPSQSVEDQQEKMVEWIEAGVRLGWLIDPYDRKVWVYRANGEVETLDDPVTLSGEDVCEGLVVDMLRVW